MSGPPTRDAVLNAIGHVLSSAACQAVDFTYHNLRIYGHGYQTVKFATAENRIHISILATTRNNGAKASYDIDNNVFIIPVDFTIAGVISEMSLVHESTHALMNAMYPGTRIKMSINEGIAYLADAIYFYNSGLTTSQATKEAISGHLRQYSGWNTALDIAPNVLSGGSAVDAVELIAADVERDPRYAKELREQPFANFQGIPAATWLDRGLEKLNP
jgi:hypothetical protein